MAEEPRFDFSEWAGAHSLVADTDSPQPLPGLTPILRGGDATEVVGTAEGVLPGGLDAEVSHFNQVDRRDDAPDRRTPYTVVLTSVPEILAFVPSLSCRPKGSGGGSSFNFGMAGDEVDSTYAADRKVELESVELRERYDVRIDPEVGDNWIRQLFSPAFIAWLCDERHREVRFELEQGALCVYRPSHLEDEDGLANLCEEAAEIARRLREEALEEDKLINAGEAALPTRRERSREAWIARNAEKVDWTSPPADVPSAMRAYRWLAMRYWKPWVYGITATVGGILIGLALLFAEEGRGLLFLLGGPFLGVSIFWTIVNDRSKAFGKWAFAGGYARTRSFELENPRLFQARNMRLGFPGVAETAFAGAVGPGGTPGNLVFSFSGRGSKRQDYNVLTVPLTPEQEASLPKPPGDDSADWAVRNHALAVWLPSHGDAKRTADGIDEFRRVAGERVEKLLSA